jgi:serine/threonine protein kinase/dipeptidyl aminopeptidase/acylaminoacyl peptidase
MLLAPDMSFDRFEIRALLGKGGMGEVYLAHDTLHNRPVALKLLPPEFANNADRLRRFEQEAHAASALNHHNIIVTYEIGQVESIPFIAMEFVEGETLRRYLKRSPMPVSDVIEVVAQIAQALSAAHESGIVHRDIKPENIMLSNSLQIKVLDFGLAKLMEPMRSRVATPEASTVTNLSTGPGAVLGTTNYMSPEQLRGLTVDARTDIWSMGIVLYELLTAELPFKGHNTNEVIVSILEREPQPIALNCPGIPIGLERVIRKSLRKNREERYQTARELLVDLINLQNGIELQDEACSEEVVIQTSQQLVVNTDPVAAPLTNIDSASQPAIVEPAIVEPVSSGLKYYKGAVTLLLLLALTVMLGRAAWNYSGSLLQKPARPERQMQVSRIMFSSNAREAVISPDGKFIAATLLIEGKQSIWLRELATSADVQLVAPADKQYKGLVFSPDGAYIYFLSPEQEDGTLFRVSRNGGQAKKLIEHVHSPAALSPDGQRVVFVRNYFEGDETALIVAAADGSGDARQLATRKLPEEFTLGGYLASGPAWSPDGKVIACPTTVNNPAGSYMKLVAVRVTDGAAIDIPSRRWDHIERIAWLANGDGLLMNASDEHISPSVQVWLVPYPQGEARRVTFDADFHESVSLTSDASTLVTVQSNRVSDIWTVTNDGSSSATQITASKYKGTNGLAWLPDGDIVYTSSEGDNQDIWVMKEDGSERRRLTFDQQDDLQPTVARDGSRIAFISYRNGGSHIWVMDADGSNQRQLTDGAYEDMPYFSPDGQWIIYHGFSAARDSLLKVSVAGGAPIPLTQQPAIQPAISPDGQQVACYLRDDRPDSSWKIAILSFTSGETLKVFDVPETVGIAGQTIRWTPDGSALTYVANLKGVSNIWSQSINGGAPHPMTSFKENEIFSFAWAADGKQLICVRGLVVRDVILRRDFLTALPL